MTAKNIRRGHPGKPLTAEELGRLLFEVDHSKFPKPIAWGAVDDKLREFRTADAAEVLEHVTVTWKEQTP